MRKILLYEDDPKDIEIITENLKEGFPNTTIVIAENREQFIDRLADPDIEVILSDYFIPEFSGMEALDYCQHHYPRIPFLFVTGTLGDEEMAAETVLAGASAFILKDNLGKLIPTIETFAPNLKDQENISLSETSRRIVYLLKLSLDLQRRVHRHFSDVDSGVDQDTTAKLLLVRETLHSALKYLDTILTKDFD